jgi:hypothetical protein
MSYNINDNIRAETIAYAKTNIGPEVFQRSMEKHGNSPAVKVALEKMQVSGVGSGVG